MSVSAGNSASVARVSKPSEGHARKRNPRGQGDRLRDEIVEAAAALLDQTGSAESVTLRAVARRARISAPSIYRHFADPQAILLAVTQEAFELLRGRLAEASESAPEDPTARLKAVCQGYLTFVEEHPARYRVMFGGVWTADPGSSDSVSEADLLELGAAALEILTASLVDCIESGASISTAPHTDAIALWLGLHGLAHQRTVVPHFPWPEDLPSRIIHLLASLEPGR